MGVSRNSFPSDTEKLIRPVSRATLPQEIVKALTDLIMKRVWKPGDLIPSEKELAIRFEVGRSTIREAVKSLVVLGVLEARAGEGSFVREPTSELLSGGFRWGLLLSEGNLDDFVDVRVLIEVECARRAAANKTEELVSQLNTTIEEMRAEPMDHSAFMDSDTRFHLAIAHAARNPIFETVGSTIQSIVRIWYPKTYYIPETKSSHHRRASDDCGRRRRGRHGRRGRSDARASRRCGAALAHASPVPGNARPGER